MHFNQLLSFNLTEFHTMTKPCLHILIVFTMHLLSSEYVYFCIIIPNSLQYSIIKFPSLTRTLLTAGSVLCVNRDWMRRLFKYLPFTL